MQNSAWGLNRHPLHGARPPLAQDLNPEAWPDRRTVRHGAGRHRTNAPSRRSEAWPPGFRYPVRKG